MPLSETVIECRFEVPAEFVLCGNEPHQGCVDTLFPTQEVTGFEFGRRKSRGTPALTPTPVRIVY